jgi:hypothetical protein
MDNVLKLSLAIAVVTIAASVAYFSVVAMPAAQQREAAAKESKLRQERIQECERNRTEILTSTSATAVERYRAQNARCAKG